MGVVGVEITPEYYLNEQVCTQIAVTESNLMTFPTHTYAYAVWMHRPSLHGSPFLTYLFIHT